MRKILLSSFLSLILMAGCSTSRPVDISSVIADWYGKDTDVLARAWGPPDRVYDFRDGIRIMEYEFNQVEQYRDFDFPHGAVSVSSDGAVIGTQIPLWRDEPALNVRRCLIRFETTTKRVIQKGTYQGNSCAYILSQPRYAQHSL